MTDAAPLAARPRLRAIAGAALLAALAVALRCWDFGNPVIHVDEQWYLLVGDRLLHGAVPYLDLWDRKPVGLFLLFAAIRLLPGDGILAYQLVATAFAWATATVVGIAARRVGAGRVGALAAGAAYLFGCSLLGGRGGQAPVFYDLPVALAGLLVLGLPANGRRRLVANGALACLLAGLAVQIKTSAVFEALFVGLACCWQLWRGGARPAAVVAAALSWAALGAAPTLAAWGWYAARGAGAGHAWWFANVVSITLRPGYPADQLLARLAAIVAVLSPLLLCAGLSWRDRPRDGTAAASARRLAFAWLAAAGIGFVAIGTFFDHYALPLLAPLAVAASPCLGRSARALVGTVGLAATLFAVERGTTPDDAAGARQLAAVVRANSAGGGACPWVFVGDTITYHLAGACLPTAYAFPNLLAYTTEQGATGIDEAAEVRRILATRPPVIVSSTRRLAIWNQRSLAAVRRALAHDYRPVFATSRARWRSVVYLRRDRRFVPG